ncbi:MAG: PQQ-binding-like beta-propeller repeat protein [Kiritimatiellia bacterium]
MKINFYMLFVTLILIHVSALAENSWTMFRGAQGDGTAKGANLPLHWSETENVRWKTALPNQGWSTPAVQGKRIWLTCATEKGEDFFAICVDAESGKIIIEKRLFHTDTPEPLGNSVNGYASPSPAIEPGRVYIHFGSYGTACLNAENGDLIWQRDDLPCRHYRGPGSSPILYKDLLILTFDGVDQQYLAALNKHNGKSVWTTKREIQWKDLNDQGQPKREGDFRKGFTTPLVIDVKGRSQLISPASNVLFAYEPESGKEIWRIQSSTHTPVVIPVYADGLVLAVTGHGAAEMLAIRPDGEGDVTASHVVWRIKGKDVPDTPSPVALDGLLYMLSDHGALNCIEIKTGIQVWREALRNSYIASPIHNGERIYLFSVSGKATIIRAGRAFEKLAENNLNAGFMASPAVAGNALILRTKTHLYWIEEK